MPKSAKTTRAKNVAYKCTLYGIALFIIALLQVSFFSKITVFGGTADLLLASVITLCVYEEHRVCAICGIISGFLYCALGGFSYPIYIAFSFIFAYVFWIVAEHTFGKNYPSFLALSLIGFGAKALYNFIEISMSASTFNILRAFSKIVLPEFIASMLFCSVSYVFIYACTRLFNKKSKSRKEGTK